MLPTILYCHIDAIFYHYCAGLQFQQVEPSGAVLGQATLKQSCFVIGVLGKGYQVSPLLAQRLRFDLEKGFTAGSLTK